MNITNANDLQGDIDRSVQILWSFAESKRNTGYTAVPPTVLEGAYALALVRLVRIGLVVTSRFGTGVVIARCPDGSWSAPSSFSMKAIGVGRFIGGEVVDSIIVIRNAAALDDFINGRSSMMGTNAGLPPAGLVGRVADLVLHSNNPSYAIYSLCNGRHVRGNYEISKLSTRAEANTAFYGRPLTAAEILTGGVPVPNTAQPLYESLNSLVHTLKSVTPVACMPCRDRRCRKRERRTHSRHCQCQRMGHFPQETHFSSPPTFQPVTQNVNGEPPSYESLYKSTPREPDVKSC